MVAIRLTHSHNPWTFGFMFRHCQTAGDVLHMWMLGRFWFNIFALLYNLFGVHLSRDLWFAHLHFKPLNLTKTQDKTGDTGGIINEQLAEGNIIGKRRITHGNYNVMDSNMKIAYLS